MSGLLEKEQSKATIVGNVCQIIVNAVLNSKEEEGLIMNIESEEPVVEVDVTEKGGSIKEVSGNFILDFSFVRKKDKQKVFIWVSHRAKSDNSHTYFWGLVDEVRQARKHSPDALCVFIVLGNKKGWKDWIFPASLLFFDYTIFVGEFQKSELYNFTFERAKTIEEDVKKRLIASQAEDIDSIIQNLLNKGYSSDEIKNIVVRAISKEINNNSKIKTVASSLLGIYNGLKSCLRVQEFNHNEFAKKLYIEIQKLSKPSDLARKISTSVKEASILEATCYLYVLLFGPTIKKEIIQILKRFYDDEKLADNACNSLIQKKIMLEKESLLQINPEVIIALIQSIENVKNELCNKDDLIEEFAYKFLTSKFSKRQYEVLQDIKRKRLLSEGIDRVLSIIKNDINRKKTNRIINASKPSLKGLLKILEKRKNVIQRREKILFDFLSILVEKGKISEESGCLKIKHHPEIDQTRYLLLHNLTSRTDLFDPYVLFLNEKYRIKSIKNAWDKLTQVYGTDKLISAIEELDENGIRLIFEVAICSVGETSTAIRNAVETAVASTGIWAFLRGDRDLPNSVKQSIINFFKTRNITSDWQSIGEEILKKRIQQIKRNSRINVLEELVFTGLAQARLIFLGTPQKQGDVYLRSLVNEVGLKCLTSSSERREEKRGEDFVIPTNRGVCVAIQCRASPQSYEARRMAGHSLQFDVEWKNNSWVLRKDLIHVAVVDGDWKKEWIENLFDAGYEKIFSAEEIDELIKYLESNGAIRSSSPEYFEKLQRLQSFFESKELTPREILEEINKLVTLYNL